MKLDLEGLEELEIPARIANAKKKRMDVANKVYMGILRYAGFRPRNIPTPTRPAKTKQKSIDTIKSFGTVGLTPRNRTWIA